MNRKYRFKYVSDQWTWWAFSNAANSSLEEDPIPFYFDWYVNKGASSVFESSQEEARAMLRVLKNCAKRVGCDGIVKLVWVK